MSKEKRDYRVYYVPCPGDFEHFILADPADPQWEKAPPQSPSKIDCPVCGKREVDVTDPWAIGYVSAEERDQGWSLSKPNLPSSP
jgi:hypothetical protein